MISSTYLAAEIYQNFSSLSLHMLPSVDFFFRLVFYWEFKLLFNMLAICAYKIWLWNLYSWPSFVNSPFHWKLSVNKRNALLCFGNYICTLWLCMWLCGCVCLQLLFICLNNYWRFAKLQICWHFVILFVWLEQQFTAFFSLPIRNCLQIAI